MSAGRRLQRLEAQDVSAMSAGEAQAALRDIGVIRGKADQLEGAISRRISELHDQGDAAPAADLLGRNGRTSRRSAERAQRRADTLGHTPQLDAALGKGTVAGEHADALAGVAAGLDDGQRERLFDRDREITELAAAESPERFRRRLGRIADEIVGDDGLGRAEQQAAAARVTTTVDDGSGMHSLVAKLTPEQGNRVRRALDHEVNTLAKLPEHRGKRRDQIAAPALVNLVCGQPQATGAGPAELVVLVSYDKLVGETDVDGLAEYSDGTPVPAETARRVACEADIIPVVLGGDSMPLDVGRARRLATPAQRVALRAMYRTCAIGGCDRHFDRSDIHHLLEWDELGPTDLDNLLPLCSFHHHRAHEGRWRLQLDPSTRQLTVRLPDGSLHSTSWPDVARHDGLAA